MLTGYAATKRVNKRLEDEGFKAIPPQMIYQYMSKGYITTELIEGKKLVTEDEIDAWTSKYIARKKARASI